MTTVITAVPSRDQPATFADDADTCLAQLAAFSAEVSVLEANLTAAVATATSGLAAGLWVSGTTYGVGDLRFSPATGYLYRRRTAGAGTTDPSADATNWALQTVMGMPLVVVTSSTHTIEPSTYCVLTYSGAVTLTAPATPSSVMEWGIKVANGRWDNVLDGNGNNVEGQTDSVYLDYGDASGVWRWFGATLGYGRA